jgi:uncharacterized damage-inducible protein DinB
LLLFLLQQMSLEEHYLQSVIKRFKEYKSLGEKTFNQLNDEDFIYKPNETSNSIAVIIKHMHGNMQSRWTNFLTEDGEKNWRKRDDEFEEESLTKEQLIHLWEEGWQTFLSALESLSFQDILKTVTIRSQQLTVTDAINRQLAHYSYHVGQIVYIGRMIKDTKWINLSIPKKTS